MRFSTSARLSRPHKSKCASECVICCVSDLNWCLRPHTSSCAEGACVCQSAHVCVCVAGPGRAAALSVQSVTLRHRRLFHVPPGPGEAVSGQGARSQGSHTAAHCPGLRAASQRQGGGGLAARPPLWGYVSRALGVAAGSGRPERASSPQLPATRLRRWARAALTAAPSVAACKEGAHCLVRTLTRGFRTDTMLQ